MKNILKNATGHRSCISWIDNENDTTDPQIPEADRLRPGIGHQFHTWFCRSRCGNTFPVSVRGQAFYRKRTEIKKEINRPTPEIGSPYHANP